MGNFTKNRDRILTQAEFVRRLSGSIGCTNIEAEKWLKAIKKELTSCLLDGLSVKLVEFGTFEPRRRVARRHPHNAIMGGEYVFKEKTVAHLTPSKKLNRILTKVEEMRTTNE